MSECVFCNFIQQKMPSSLIYEDEVTIAFLDHRPLMLGHAVVALKPHRESLAELTVEEIGATSATVLRIAKLLDEVLDPCRISIVSLGSEVRHFHMHVLPYQSRDPDIGYKIFSSRPHIDSAEIEELAHRLRTRQIESVSVNRRRDLRGANR